jgi:hypothetical protein
MALPTGVPTVPCANVEALLVLRSIALDEEVDVDDPFLKAVGITGGAFWGMDIFPERGDGVMGTEVAVGSTKGFSTTNERASLRMRDCLLKT